MQAELDGNLPSKVPGKAVSGVCILLEKPLNTVGPCTAGARLWRSCTSVRSQMLVQQEPIVGSYQNQEQKLSSYIVCLVPSTDKALHCASWHRKNI